MKLFAEHVAPRLRADTAKMFAQDFPDMERKLAEAPL
jgi:hypothetical protein